MLTTTAAAFLPYGRQSVDDDDIAAVAEVLRSEWLTTGPQTEAFESDIAQYVGAADAVAVSSGTAALHAAIHAIGLRPGDEVIVPPVTFVATANSVVYEGGVPVFADVSPETLLIDPAAVEKRITPRTRAIIAVDYAGQPCNYEALRSLASRHGLWLIADACHALGASFMGRKVGSIADLTVFSFHPVKHITTGEGGMITTSDHNLARRMRVFRNHGITTTARERADRGSWSYEMTELGYNYRISDLQCALGRSQLRRLEPWIGRRNEIAAAYDRAFAGSAAVEPLRVRSDCRHAYHLYVVRTRGNRDRLYTRLRHAGIGVNVHYIPVHLQPFYQVRFGTRAGLCPVAEAAYAQILSLPVFPRMTDDDVARVIESMERFAE